MRKTRTIALAIVTMLIAACNEQNRFSTAYMCRFMFRSDYHPTTLLARVLNNMGMFVKVTIQNKNGITNLNVSPNDGNASEDIPLTTELEKRYDYSNVGANQCIIIGCTTSGEWRAYDGQCPYCLDNYSGTNFPLSWTNSGNAVQCAKCKRTYNLNYDGISDDGNRLLQYNVRSDGTIITVTNT